METNNYKDLIFNKINELKKLTISQKKTIMAGDIDIYVSIERFRSNLRKEIDEIKASATFDLQEYKAYKLLLDELIELEKKNKKLLLDWSESLKAEKNNIRNIRKVSSVYLNKNKLPIQSKFVNKIS